MPLAAALLLAVQSRETAQAQGALQGNGRHVTGGACPKARHEHHQPLAVAAGVQSNLHHLLALQGLADRIGLGHLLPRVRVRN